MSIVKMKSVTFAGQIDEFDSVVEKYIYGRDIHLERAMSVLSNRKNIQPFEDTDEYKTLSEKALGILKLTNNEVTESSEPKDSSFEYMQEFLEDISRRVEQEQKRSDELNMMIEANNAAIEQTELMMSADVDISKLRAFEFISFRFGHIPKTSYKTLITYLDELEVIFVKTAEDESDMWGFYFTPRSKEGKIDEIFGSLYFETVHIPKTYTGTPKEIKKHLIEENEGFKREQEKIAEDTSRIVESSVEEICAIYNFAKKREQFATVRRMAVHSDVFFYVVAWMPEKEAASLEREIEKSGDTVMVYVDSPESVRDIQPPTKLKNNFIFKPFEMFVKMYGLPSYGEIDPTPILAITYILFFGIMFGDVGQAAVLAILGFIVYKKKKMDLAGIVGTVGISGVIFGFVYGSFFGDEELIPKLLHTTPIHPMEQAISMLIATIAIGALIIIFGIALNVINSAKRKNYGEMIFGHNGIAGLVFYVSGVLLALNMIFKLGIPSAVFAALITAAVVSMYMCEPLSKLVSGEKKWFPKDGMFFVENFFELFEVVLSFFTNTLSFLRIGAFAIVHVGMMIVISVLSSGGGVGGAIALVLGNILVMALEGLIVGIQVLRLEYYEMFSRYFTGSGKEFISLKDK